MLKILKTIEIYSGSCSISNDVRKIAAFAKELVPDRILEKLGGLPIEDKHCAFLSADALQEALNDYMIKQQKKLKEKLPQKDKK